MRAIWIDEGNDANYAKLAALGITEPCYSLRDPRVTKPYLQAAKAHAGVTAVGVYFAWNWWPALTGVQLAEKVSALCAPLFKSTAPDFPYVCADIEAADTGYAVAFLRRWRELRPQRVTDWTLEGHKGATLPAATWLVVSGLVRYVVPQCYNGAMTQTWDTFAMADDLYDHGLPFHSVRPFYDAAHLPEWWDGYAFTQGRLP